MVGGSLMANRKELVLEETEGGCIVPVSHKLNQDGYFRKFIGGSLVMFHRHVWEEAGNSIPEGHEVDHLCRNRACCNVEHLQVLSTREHKVKTNKERSRERIREAEMVWREEGVSGGDLAEEFGVGLDTAWRWIRGWR
jgi:hypothetical protein